MKSDGGGAGRYRFLVISLVWLAFFLGAFDRSNVSLLLVDPGFLREMGLESSPERQGLVMTMLLFPYALSNIFLSPSVDRWGPRRVLTLMTGLWAAVALLMGTASSYLVLLAGRSARGLAEGPLFPVANRTVRYWFPPSERGLANAIWTSGQRVGLALSVPVLTFTIAALGWRFSFFLQSALVAATVCPALWFLMGDRPEVTRRVGEKEIHYITQWRRDEQGKPAQWRHDLPLLLGNYRYWLMVTYHLGLLAVYYGMITWLPKYLKEGRGFDAAHLVVFATLPHVAAAIASILFGALSDRFPRLAAFCVVGLGGAGISVCVAALAPDPTVSAALMVLGFGFWGMGSPSYYAIMQRIIPGNIMATGIGIDNGLANLGSAIVPTLVGLLVGATGSYLAGLLLIAGLGVAGSLAALALAVQKY